MFLISTSTAPLHDPPVLPTLSSKEATYFAKHLAPLLALDGTLSVGELSAALICTTGSIGCYRVACGLYDAATHDTPHWHSAVSSSFLRLCLASARLIHRRPIACAEAIVAARERGARGLLEDVSTSVINVASFSAEKLATLVQEIEIDAIPVDEQQFHSVSDEAFFEAVDRQPVDDHHRAPRDGKGQRLMPVGRVRGEGQRGLGCANCQSTGDGERVLIKCRCRLGRYCCLECVETDVRHNCTRNKRDAQLLVSKLSVTCAVAVLREGLAFPVSSLDGLRSLTAPVWYPRLTTADHLQLFRLLPIVVHALEEAELVGRFDELLKTDYINRPTGDTEQELLNDRRIDIEMLRGLEV